MSAPQLAGWRHIYSGKVRDLYAPVDPASGEPRPDQLLLVASDRISAFDFILDSPIPDKGEVLTRLSLWWFAQLEDLVPNHVISTDVPDAVRGRAVLVERLEMLPVECVARAYLTGGGLGEYAATGAVSGIALPAMRIRRGRAPGPAIPPPTRLRSCCRAAPASPSSPESRFRSASSYRRRTASSAPPCRRVCAPSRSP